MLAINIESAMKDPTAWEDPETFLPERHLDEDGKLIKNDAHIPFGLGISTIDDMHLLSVILIYFQR